MNKHLVMLMILDGYGHSDIKEGNAVEQANTPFLDEIFEKYPSAYINASGLDVGLPDGQMGNSEVGHLNIGAGRIVYQELTRITKSIENGDFFENEALIAAMDYAKENNKGLHLMGLLSDGGVHSHQKHLYALIDMAKRRGLTKVYIHAFMDGRDTPPNGGTGYMMALEDQIKEIGVGQIATVSGRYYAMDRDNRWERIEKAYTAMVDGEGNTAATAIEAVDTSYANDVTDEFIIPTVINPNEEQRIKKGDAIICFDFRPDRVRQITRALTVEEFSEFERKAGYLEPYMVTFTMYDKTLTNVKDIAFKKETLKNTLGEYLSKKNKKQLRIAETEKYAHVTYFFNGGIEKQYEGEDRALIASPKVATYDLQPEMSAEEVTDTLLEKMEETDYDVIILNYANCDMVGHTAIFPAVVKAVETVDTCSKRIIEAVLAKGGEVIVTADHGNAEKLVDLETHEAFTAHTTNPVPCILATNDKTVTGIREGGRLSDLAPTMLDRLGMKIPEEMTGKTLIKQ